MNTTVPVHHLGKGGSALSCCNFLILAELGTGWQIFSTGMLGETRDTSLIVCVSVTVVWNASGAVISGKFKTSVGSSAECCNGEGGVCIEVLAASSTLQCSPDVVCHERGDISGLDFFGRPSLMFA